MLVVDGADERDVGVAGGDGADTSGLEHGDGEQRRGRLAVGAGDGEQRSRASGALLLPPVGELDLADHRPARRRGGGEEAVALGHPRGGHDEIGLRDQSGEPIVVRGRDQLDADLGGELAAPFVDRVVDGADLDPAAPQGARRRRPGHRQSVDQHVGHGRSAEIRVKSPMNRPRADATHTAAINQKRMITVVSGHPTSSK